MGVLVPVVSLTVYFGTNGEAFGILLGLARSTAVMNLLTQRRVLGLGQWWPILRPYIQTGGVFGVAVCVAFAGGMGCIPAQISEPMVGLLVKGSLVALVFGLASRCLDFSPPAKFLSWQEA